MTVTARRGVTEVETYSGKFVDFINPDPETIELVDIARGLANCCRFANQVNQFYSVAEHSVRVSRLVPEPFAMPALHHDSHEAYIGDISAPLKAVLEIEAPGVIREISDKLDLAIGMALGLISAHFKHPEVKKYDDVAMFQEAATLKYSHGIGEHWRNDEYFTPLAGIGWSPAKAERMFLERHEELCARYS